MKRKLLAIGLLLLAFFVSFGMMLIPTFFTQNISHISLSQSFQLEHILDETEDVELVFFGYSGCADVCSPRLASLGEFYEKLPTNLKKRVGIRFIDISSPEDVTLSQRFAHYFHKDFKGVNLEAQELREYTKEFGVFFSRSLSEELEFDHTSHLYLVKKEAEVKKIRYIYSAYPYDTKQIKTDIEELIKE